MEFVEYYGQYVIKSREDYYGNTVYRVTSSKVFFETSFHSLEAARQAIDENG